MKQKRQIDITATIETREAEDGKRTIVGIIPYNSQSLNMGGYVEIVTPTAFSKTLSDGADVKALGGHDMGKILGSTKNGTLRLNSLSEGLVCECDLPDTSYAHDVYEIIKRGDCTTMSFEFYDVNTERVYENGKSIDYLREVKLRAISFAVPFPAYEETKSSARELRGIDLYSLGTILEKAEFSPEDRMTLENVNRTISTLIESSAKPDTVAVPDTTAADFAASLLAASRKE